ncbi:lysophospholipase L1-like esterase [Filimonas zeae]|nr:SGNH/GDSL hydrolase family protein [Filimonas zeae]MDR6338866.1 lysophospholipase L1-like esterase [Filimonas zeae]
MKVSASFICMLAGILCYPFAGCSKGPASNTPASSLANASSGNDTTIRSKTYLALGDSYTIGQSVDPSLRFPAQTAAILNSGKTLVTPPEYIATTGWTTANLLTAIQNQNPKGPYDMVSLLIGVNDQFQHLDTAGYRLRFTQLLQKSILLAGNRPLHVFVLSIPDYSVTPFGQSYQPQQTAKEINWFNAINREITATYHCNWLDITPSTREAATNNTLVADDGLHPSGKEYRKWAEALAPMMRAIL